jgi:hypothetical protein
VTVPPADPVEFRELLVAHTQAEDARLAAIEHALGVLTERGRDSNLPRDRELGRAWRYAAVVAGVVAAIIFTAFQVSAAVDGRIDRQLSNAQRVDSILAEKRYGDVTHQLELMRRDDATQRDLLAKTLTEIKDRLHSLEQRP